MSNYLSKSDFMKYLIHPAYLWYQKNDKRKLPPIDENDQFVFDQGHQFEDLVRELYPKGKMVEGKPWEFDILIGNTQAFIDSDTEVIFQATAMGDRRLLARADILKRVEGGWKLIEVKSSTRFKDNHAYDLAFQKIAFEEAGIDIVDIGLIHADKNYVRTNGIDAEDVARKRNVHEDVMMVYDEVKKLIPKALDVMDEVKPDETPADAGDFRAWIPIYRHLNPDVDEDDDHIVNLGRLNEDVYHELYHAGIEKIDKIDENFNLHSKQRHQIDALKKGEPIIDKAKIATFLGKFKYPLYFLDYETMAHVLPPFKGMSPYQQLPFQYSLHVLDSPDGELKHYEFISKDDSHPTNRLLEQMQSDFGDDNGTVLAWYDKFEKSCNRVMADIAPEYKDFLKDINNRMTDLMIPFKNDWYIDHRFKGSASIKNVLPVLVPELSYKGLDIQEGGSAQRIWYEAFMKKDPKYDQDKVADNLLEYCKLDTLAMVEIFRVLKGLLEDDKNENLNGAEQASLFD